MFEDTIAVFGRRDTPQQKSAHPSVVNRQKVKSRSDVDPQDDGSDML